MNIKAIGIRNTLGTYLMYSIYVNYFYLYIMAGYAEAQSG